jgi:hypothetical protein
MPHLLAGMLKAHLLADVLKVHLLAGMLKRVKLAHKMKVARSCVVSCVVAEQFMKGTCHQFVAKPLASLQAC